MRQSRDVYLVLQKDVHDHILAVVASHVEGGATIGIDGIRLRGRGGGREGGREGGRKGGRRGG